MSGMSRSMSLAIVLGLTALVGPQTLRADDPPLRVVASVDLKRYAGTWYEVARLPNKFQDQCAGDVVVRYTLRDDNRVDVLNRCRTSDGRTDQARGIARKAGDGDTPARLEVRFAPAWLSLLPMVWGDYWIIGLGPDYQWAVVGVPSREYLWVLSRTPSMSPLAYAQAIEIAKAGGFDVSQVVKTKQVAELEN